MAKKIFMRFGTGCGRLFYGRSVHIMDAASISDQQIKGLLVQTILLILWEQTMTSILWTCMSISK